MTGFSCAFAISASAIGEPPNAESNGHGYRPTAGPREELQRGGGLGIVRKAYEFSAKVHEGQRRRSGEPYLQHPIAVAGVLTSLKTDVTAIVAALLHDTLEDTVATPEELESEFGKDVVHLVDGVTKIGKITFKSHEEKQAENFRKMLLSMADDIRVVLIKLADRLHNMRTLEHLSPAKRQAIAEETLEIYAPLANRLGIGWIKNELEDLCLKHLKPDVYENAHPRGQTRRGPAAVHSGGHRAGHEGAAGTRVAGAGLRPTQASLRHLSEDEQAVDLVRGGLRSDRLAHRDRHENELLRARGRDPLLWRPVPGRFKDYIAIPKSNLYQSIHTTVVGPKGERRISDPHGGDASVAECGIAAHWKYKEQGRVTDRDSKTFGWLHQFVEWHRDLPDNRQFMDSVKLDLFHDVVYVFTPKGIVKELPRGSTPVDFAYAIHTEVGDHCVGAKVNGKIVPLKHQVESGDTIEILTSPTQTPHKDWLKFVRTSRAKTKIKHWIKIEEQKRSVEIGRRLLESEFRRHGMAPAQMLKSPELAAAARQSGYDNTDEMIASVGFGHLPAANVLEKLTSSASAPLKPATPAPRKTVAGKSDDKGVKVKGARDVLMQLSRCCNPVPGDRILGYITRGGD